MNALQMEDGSALVGESDLNFIVTNENYMKDYYNEDLAQLNNGLYQEVYSSTSPDFRRDDISGSHHEQPQSSVHAEFRHDAVLGGTQSSYDHAVDKVETEAVHREIDNEALAHSVEMSQYGLTNCGNPDKHVVEEIPELPTDSRKFDTHSDHVSPERTSEQSKSPGTVGRSSISPKTSPFIYESLSSQRQLPSQQVLSNSSGSHENKRLSSPKRSDFGQRGLSNSSGSQERKCPSSPKRSDLGEEVLSGRQNAASPRGSRLDPVHADGSSLKGVSPSPKKHHSPPKTRRRDRSASRSPIRKRDSSSGYKRDHRYRSRSRSPYPRDHHRRSPRRRFSPRRRSPPSSYRSRQRSPRKRPWSPPRNRNTGIGKPGKNLFVAGFNFMTTERELERKFSRFGRVRDVRIVRDKRSGDSRGFGFLSMDTDEDADAAIRALDKTEWNGRIVLVEKSKSH